MCVIAFYVNFNCKFFFQVSLISFETVSKRKKGLMTLRARVLLQAETPTHTSPTKNVLSLKKKNVARLFRQAWPLRITPLFYDYCTGYTTALVSTDVTDIRVGSVFGVSVGHRQAVTNTRVLLY